MRDRIVASVSFGVGALVLGVLAVDGPPWMWIGVAVAAICCIGTAVVARGSRRS